MNTANISKSERFHEIDLLRFLAAFSVLLFHYTYRGWAADNMSDVAFTEIGHYFKYGYLGVHLFFIISGFVILMTALNKNAIEFTISRIVRLYPAFWFAVTLTAAVTIAIGGTRYQVEIKQYLINLSMLHRFIDVPSVDGVYWSLVVELKFYFLIFLLIIFRQIRNIQWFLTGWLLASIALTHTGHVRFVNAVLFPEWSAYFIAGAVFFLIRLRGPDAFKIALLAGSYYLALYSSYLELSGKTATVPDPASGGFYIVAGFVTLFYIIFLGISLRLTGFMNKPRFILLGALTYPLYLTHQNIGFMLFNSLNGLANKYVLLLLITVVAIAISWLINTHIEKRYAYPFKKLLINAVTFLRLRKSSQPG